MSEEELRTAVERLAAMPSPERQEALPVVERLLSALECGAARAAERVDGAWKVHAWVKRGILLCFRVGADVSTQVAPSFHFRDRETLPPRGAIPPETRVRIVPGGTTVRRGAFLGRGVVVMPPAYVNVGAWVGEGTLVDSHALVGSCAQVGARVHLSAAAQVGGVLEPVSAMPVIIEDDAFVGGGCGIYEGTRVARGAVLAAGVVITRSVPVYDLVRQCVHRGTAGRPLVIPEGAVVIPGARPAAGEFARRHGVYAQTPVIVKYRDAATDAASVLEEALR